MYSCVSSAYCVSCDELVTFEMGEMYSVNRREPSTKPYGTPYSQLKFNDCFLY